MTLSARVDGLVVVARLPILKRTTLQELNRVLSAAPTTKLGFVLTGTTASENYEAYGYDYAQTQSSETPAAWNAEARRTATAPRRSG